MAEQSSRELWAIRDQAIAQAANRGASVRKQFRTSNDVDYGFITAFADGRFDTSKVVGVDTEDDERNLSQTLRVAPLHLKGIASFIRLFAAGADITMGLQSPERYPEFLYGDSDGVVEELTVGDMTALTLAIAGGPRPVTKLELHRQVGGRYRLSRQEIREIRRGERVFNEVGFGGCHKPKMILRDPDFLEPSSTPGFFFPQFRVTYIDPEGNRGGGNPLDYGYDINNPASFDITDNPVIMCKARRPSWWATGTAEERVIRKSDADHDSGQIAGYRWPPREYSRGCWRQFQKDRRGNTLLRMFGDQKRYDMGEGLAEDVDEFGKGPSVFRTKELWGVGSTGPWLHDGRATTLTEAIFWPGGAAENVKDSFFSLTERRQDQLLNFLTNLIIYDSENDKVVNEKAYKIY